MFGGQLHSFVCVTILDLDTSRCDESDVSGCANMFCLCETPILRTSFFYDFPPPSIFVVELSELGAIRVVSVVELPRVQMIWADVNE